MADVSGAAEETINAIRTVQSFAQEDRETNRFAAATEGAFAAAARYARARALLGAIIITLVFGAIAVVLWLGGQDVLAGRITAGELSSFVFYATVVASAAGGLSDVFGDLQRAAGATERLFELLDAPTEIAAPAARRRRCRPRALARSRFERRQLRLPVRARAAGAGRLRPRRPAGRDGGPGRPVRRRQDQRLPAADALLRPRAGRILFDGVPITAARSRAPIAAGSGWCRRSR